MGIFGSRVALKVSQSTTYHTSLAKLIHTSSAHDYFRILYLMQLYIQTPKHSHMSTGDQNPVLDAYKHFHKVIRQFPTKR